MSNARDFSDALALGGAMAPVGAVLPFAGTTAPSGWALCSGQAISRTTYANLFNTIGTTYGAGDGSTTFNVPDIRGRVPAGMDNMGGTASNRLTASGSGVAGTTLGASGGAESHTLTAGQMPQHNHTVNDPGHQHNTGVNFGTYQAGAYQAAGSLNGGTSNIQTVSKSTTGITLGDAGSGQAHNNTQPTIVLNYIIKT